jgi:hypothetical protein
MGKVLPFVRPTRSVQATEQDRQDEMQRKIDAAQRALRAAIAVQDSCRATRNRIAFPQYPGSVDHA